MSTATFVPESPRPPSAGGPESSVLESSVLESSGLDGGVLDAHRAWNTLRQIGIVPLTRDVYLRLRYADGFSHARALAYQLILTAVPGVMIAVAMANILDSDTLQRAIGDAIESFVPGTAADVFTAAADQGAEAGDKVIAGGGVAFVIAGVTTFSQIQRGANRIYGIEADRPTIERYWLATRLAASAGGLLTVFFATIGLGSATEFIDAGFWRTVWLIVRWPLGAGLLAAAQVLIFKVAPRRRQPTMSWLTLGAAISTVGMLGVTIVLQVYLDAAGSFSEAYGIFAGLVGLMLWAYASAIALFVGLATAAQLEAVRAGVPAPRCARKVSASESEPLLALPTLGPLSQPR